MLNWKTILVAAIAVWFVFNVHLTPPDAGSVQPTFSVPAGYSAAPGNFSNAAPAVNWNSSVPTPVVQDEQAMAPTDIPAVAVAEAAPSNVRLAVHTVPAVVIPEVRVTATPEPVEPTRAVTPLPVEGQGFVIVTAVVGGETVQCVVADHKRVCTNGTQKVWAPGQAAQVAGLLKAGLVTYDVVD